MNKFQEGLKTTTNKDDAISCSEDKIKKIDEKISANIAKTLFYMSEKSNDIDERRQILDRMLNINNLFRKGFDEEMQVLKDREEKKAKGNGR